MRIEEFGQSSATITLTADELAVVNNALNEICNGVRVLDEGNEFATRMDVTRQEARDVLAEVHGLSDRMKALPS